MKLFLHIAFILFAFPVFAQTDTLNFKDSSGKKQGHWIVYGSDRPESGVPIDGKVEEGITSTIEKEGTWIKYRDDGKTPKIKANYENNRPVGNYFKFEDSVWTEHSFTENRSSYRMVRGLGAHDDLKNNLYEATYNSRGMEEGWVKFFYADGQLEFTYFAKDGVPVDTAFRYYQNGDLKEKVVFDELGNVSKNIEYKMIHPERVSTIAAIPRPETPANPNTREIPFKPNGFNKVYNTDNEILFDGIFSEGQLKDGKYYEYDRDGILLFVRIFKNGVYHSDGEI